MYSRSLTFLFVGFFLISFFNFSPPTVLGQAVGEEQVIPEGAAQETRSVVVADINLTDVKLTETEKGVSGTFVLQGNLGLQNDIVSGVMVTDEDGRLVDFQSLGRPVVVHEGELLVQNFSYNYPSFLHGKVKLVVRAETVSGIPLGVQPLVTKEFPAGDASFSCAAENAQMICRHERDGAVTLSYYRGSVLAPPVTTTSVTPKQGEVLTASVKLESGTYTVVARDGATGAIATFAYRQAGSYGQIRNVVLSQSVPGEVNGVIVIKASPVKDLSAKVELQSKQQTNCGSTMVTLDGTATEFTTQTSCTEGEVKLTLTDAGGKVLDTMTQAYAVKPLSSVDTTPTTATPIMSSSSFFSGKTISIAVVILLLLTFAFFRARSILHRPAGSMKIGLWFIFVAGATVFILPTQPAQASTTLHTVQFGYLSEIAYDVWGIGSAASSQYAPGEQVTINYSLDVFADAGVIGGPPATMNANIAHQPTRYDQAWSGSGIIIISTGGAITVANGNSWSTNSTFNFIVPGTMTTGTHTYPVRMSSTVGPIAIYSNQVSVGDVSFNVQPAAPPTNCTFSGTIPWGPEPGAMAKNDCQVTGVSADVAPGSDRTFTDSDASGNGYTGSVTLHCNGGNMAPPIGYVSSTCSQAPTGNSCTGQTIQGCVLPAVTNVSSSYDVPNDICQYAESPSSISAGTCDYRCTGPNTWTRDANTCITQVPSKFTLSGNFSTACGTTSGTLSWSDPSPQNGRAVATDAGRAAHHLYRNGSLISENLYSFTDTGLTAGNVYTYTVRGSNQVGDGPLSDSFVVTIPAACGSSAPTATISSTGPVTLGEPSLWERVVSWVTGRDHVALANHQNTTITVGQNARIDWSSTNADSCSIDQGIGSVAPNASGNLRLTGLSVGTHTYTITCRKSGQTDATHSTTITVTNPGGGCCSTGDGSQVPSLSANQAGCGTGKIDLSWSAITNATGYELRDGSTTIYSGASRTYSHTGLVAGSSHSYTVRATGASGNSSWSSPATLANAPGSCSATYNIISSANTGCNISPLGTVNNIPSGGSQSYTISASPSYTLTSVNVDGLDIGAVASHTFSNIVGNHTISATCSASCVPTNPSCAASTCSSTQCWTGCSWVPGTQVCALPCINGADDDGDGLIDSADPGCYTDLNPNNAATFESDNDESDTIQVIGLPSVQNVSASASRTLRYRVIPQPVSASMSWSKECRLLDYNSSILYDWTTVPPAAPSEPMYSITTPATDGVYQYRLECRNTHYPDRQGSGTISLIIGTPVPAGSIGPVTNCEIADGATSCTGFISWEAINVISARLDVTGGSGVIPDYYDGLTGVNEGFLLPRQGTFSVELLNTSSSWPYPILATSTIQASCRAGSAWVMGRCQAGPRITALTINGTSGSYAAARDENLTVSWTTANTLATTVCTPSGIWGGTGAKDRAGGNYSDTATISGTYTLTCSTPGYPDATASVNLSLSCVASCGAWGACGPPCAGGNGQRSRTCVAADCTLYPDAPQACTTTVCRDLNWKEVAP